LTAGDPITSWHNAAGTAASKQGGGTLTYRLGYRNLPCVRFTNSGLAYFQLDGLAMGTGDFTIYVIHEPKPKEIFGGYARNAFLFDTGSTEFVRDQADGGVLLHDGTKAFTVRRPVAEGAPRSFALRVYGSPKVAEVWVNRRPYGRAKTTLTTVPWVDPSFGAIYGGAPIGGVYFGDLFALGLYAAKHEDAEFLEAQQQFMYDYKVPF
jgi:hypothetical protein